MGSVWRKVAPSRKNLSFDGLWTAIPLPYLMRFGFLWEIVPWPSQSILQGSWKNANDYSYLHSADQNPTLLSAPEEPAKKNSEAGSGPTIEPSALEGCEFQCKWENCCEVCSNSEVLTQHLYNHCEDRKELGYCCVWQGCLRRVPFAEKYQLKMHVLQHSGAQPSKCHLCPKQFRRKQELRSHLFSHSGQTPYKCRLSDCNQAFNNASDRAKHMKRTHSNEKPYKCALPNCVKRFTDPSSLRKHTINAHKLEAWDKLKQENLEKRIKQAETRYRQSYGNLLESQSN